MKRGGRAFAEVSRLHRRSPKRIWARETWRSSLWAALLPASLLAAFFIHPAALLALLLYPLQVVRLALVERNRLPPPARATPWLYAFFMTLAKFPEALGVIEAWFGLFIGRPAPSGERPEAKLESRLRSQS
jgi:hypothetical protein